MKYHLNEDASKLLMAFIADSFSQSGKPSKKTLIDMLRFISSIEPLQSVVNGCDSAEIKGFDLLGELSISKEIEQ
ncbi:MAG: hypothetical protein ACRDD9_23655 [Shewanella sp.]